MAKAIKFTDAQIEELRAMMVDGADHDKTLEYFGVSDSKLSSVCKENNIKPNWVKEYECVVCGKSFKARKVTAICPECKATPSVCVICGKEFKRTHPYTQKTCSAKCRGIYRAQSGIAKAGAQKMKETKLEKYGTLDPSEVAKKHSGKELDPKICPLCGKEFIPKTTRQVYCTDIHYVPCPVCGKMTELKDVSTGPQACSEACRMARINQTCLERYGNKDAVNSEHAKKLAKEHSLERYGKEYYTQTDEYKERAKQTNLEKYGVENPMQSVEIQNKAKQTNLEKYGTEYAMQAEEVKEKVKKTHEERYGGIGISSPELRSRITATNREKYGVDFPFSSPEFQEKIKQSNIDKFGTAWPATLPEVNERRKATNLEKYGAENPYGSKEIQDKVHEYWTEKYGGPNPMYDPEMALLMSQRQQEAMVNKYGVNSSMLVPEIREKINKTMRERYGVDWYVSAAEFDARKISGINKAFSERLAKIGISNSFEVKVGGRSYDIGIDNSNILIEIDPTVTHNTVQGLFGPDSVAHPDSQLIKTEKAEAEGYRCIHIFDWDSQLHILSMLKKKESIYARKCKLMKVDKRTASLFTEQYHLQGKCRGQDEVYGLYYEGELMQMMSFGKPRYAKKEGYDFELLRLCTRFGYRVIGGASKLFNAFKKDNPGASVISYCDRAKFSGKVYEEIGMSLLRVTPPNKIWSKGSKYITDNYLRQQGFDRIFKENHGKGTSNEALILEKGYLPVYDCGQKVFVFTPND